MTVLNVAEMLSINPETVRRWIRSGQLHASKTKEDMFDISYDDLMLFLNTKIKYKQRIQPKTDDAVIIKLQSLETKLNALEAVISSLKEQHETIQNEIKSLKETMDMKGSLHESKN